MSAIRTRRLALSALRSRCSFTFKALRRNEAQQVNLSSLHGDHRMNQHPILSPQAYVPAETSPHLGTLMTWPTLNSVCGPEAASCGVDLSSTRAEVAEIVQTIARFEPMHLFVRDDSENLDSARGLLGSNSNVTIRPTEWVESLWARDTGPVGVAVLDQLSRSPVIGGVVLNFNQWGGKLDASADEKFAPAALEDLKIDELVPRTQLRLEGGALEFDGERTMLATESSVINKNRNPGWSKGDIELELRRLFGVRKVIWLKGVKGQDITDWHVDAVTRFIEPGKVLLQRPHPRSHRVDLAAYKNARKILEAATDANDRRLEIVEIEGPDISATALDEEAVVSYVNYYVGNGFVAMASFGDKKADRAAKETIGLLFPTRSVQQVNLFQLAEQGGGIHCATQQIPDITK